jgi:hypothetical protein
MLASMTDQQLAEACRLQAEQAELDPALVLLQKRGQLGATLVALAQALGIPQSQLQEPIGATNVSHARALAHRLAEARVQFRQQGMEPAIYFAPQPREPQRQSRPRPLATAAGRDSFLKPPAHPFVPAAAPKPLAAPEERDPKPPAPRFSLNISLSIEQDRAGQIVVSNVRLAGRDAANYEVLAQAQDETSSTDGTLRSLGIIVELEHR